jgi:hypothetical protein
LRMAPRGFLCRLRHVSGQPVFAGPDIAGLKLLAR